MNTGAGKPDIRVLVCCHREFPVPKHPLLQPVQVGAALSERRIPGFLYDDSGENISEKNRSYCELTALYWAWKNLDADYYGLFHYRRYLMPRQNASRPYYIGSEPSEEFLERNGYNGFADLVSRYDLILPMRENLHVPVREHYACAAFHHREDLMTVEKIIRESYPQYTDALERYFASELHYFCNIAIMRKEVFFDYCEWLFAVLREFDARTDRSGYSVQEQRVDGYLAERLLGVYCTYRRDSLRILELPRVHFESSGKKRFLKKAELFVLPAGSRARAFVKKGTIFFRGDE